MCDNTTRGGLGQPTWMDRSAIVCLILGPAEASMFLAGIVRNATVQDWSAYDTNAIGLVLGVLMSAVGCIFALFGLYSRIEALRIPQEGPEDGKEEEK